MKNQRKVLLIVLALSGVCLLSCCGGGFYYVYRQSTVVVDSYKTTATPTFAGTQWNTWVSCHHRIDDGWGERLIGPPYWMMFQVKLLNPQITRARIHSVYFVKADGTKIPGMVTNGDKLKEEESEYIFLYAIQELTPLDLRPELIADVEVYRGEESSRGEIVFPLRKESKASLNFP